MTKLLLRLFVRDYENTSDPAVRLRCGQLAGAVGIVLNLLLFAGKGLAGLITGAISITADAFNNLSDAASSVVTLVGFRLAGQRADREHPFGHGRMEYLAGLAVSALILVVGVELAKTSVEKIISPEEAEFSLLSTAILGAAIVVKLWMGLFNRSLGRKVDSPAMAATAADSLSDSLATTGVLVGTLISHLTHVNLDGWIGLLVSVLVLRAGWGAAKDTLDPLLGQPPRPELVEQVKDIILSHPQVVGIHDLIFHDYGPGRVLMSAHAEVSAHSDLLEVHDVIDHIERELHDTCGLEAVIHMDPIITDDEETNRLRAWVLEEVQAVDGAFTIHDFRMTAGPLHTNLIFDVLAPSGCSLTDEEIARAVKDRVEQDGEHYFAVIQVDRDYTR